MGLAHQSIATINSPEFINLEPLDINPLMSSCEIKVLYLGENRNRSYISKDVATEMAKTLRGAPIVGYYKKDKQDFADHGEQLIWDDEGIHFNCLTKPYGFVSPDAKVWFQDFEDTDDFGNTISRTYLMTTGYLWTGQFEEVQNVIANEGKPQSMQLQEETLKGRWSTNNKNDVEFFIINDAIFSKLCILGEDVQPCFEGAGIIPSEVSKTFTLDDNFKHTLFEMMQELTDALKGGNAVINMDNFEAEVSETTEEVVEENFSAENEDINTESSLDEIESHIEEDNSSFQKKEDEEDSKEKSADEEDSSDDKEDEEKDKDEDKYSLLKEDYENLKSEYSSLKEEIEELRSFKLNIENQQKDELINQFYMLSDEDKKDVIENKVNYSLDEIKSKLAVICFEKKVNFTSEETSKNDNDMKDEKSVTTFNIENTEDSTPDWVKEVESRMNRI